MKYALCAIALAALVTPALAANEFYVVQDSARRGAPSWSKNTVTMKVVGSVYNTKAKAEVAMKVTRFATSVALVRDGDGPYRRGSFSLWVRRYDDDEALIANVPILRAYYHRVGATIKSFRPSRKLSKERKMICPSIS
jgi:hypothetical protein